MAIRLTDIVLRRTSLGALGPPGDEAVHECARIAAVELGWDATRTAEEVSALNLFYAIRLTSRSIAASSRISASGQSQ